MNADAGLQGDIDVALLGRNRRLNRRSVDACRIFVADSRKNYRPIWPVQMDECPVGGGLYRQQRLERRLSISVY